jgi:hypothetical protein
VNTHTSQYPYRQSAGTTATQEPATVTDTATPLPEVVTVPLHSTDTGEFVRVVLALENLGYGLIEEKAGCVIGQRSKEG